jgi:hypothetical protein
VKDISWKDMRKKTTNGLRYWALGRAWILFGSRKKLEARKMLVNCAESPASSARFVGQFLMEEPLC